VGQWLAHQRAAGRQPARQRRAAAGARADPAAEEVNRPVAFSTPLAASHFEALCTFDPASELDIHAVLYRFEGWLQPLLFKAALGAQIIEHGTALRGGIFHVREGARLLAVLDFRHGRAAVLPGAQPVALQQASTGNGVRPVRMRCPKALRPARPRNCSGLMRVTPRATCSRSVTAPKRFITGVNPGCRWVGCATPPCA
jgi:hypothetical protein